VNGCDVPLIGCWHDSEPIVARLPVPAEEQALVPELNHSTSDLVQGVKSGTRTAAGGWARPKQKELKLKSNAVNDGGISS
jgi:hypothetical protein